MLRYALVYGSISGAIIIGSIIVNMTVTDLENSNHSMLFGFLIMFIALSVIFVAVKRYRDQKHGGVIKFGQAFLAGLSVALVASIIYVVTWEAYLAITGYDFAADYMESTLRGLEAKGATAAEISEKMAKLEASMANYDNPLFRIPITFTEIMPVGLLIALISAAVLRNPKVLPARSK